MILAFEYNGAAYEVSTDDRLTYVVCDGQETCYRNMVEVPKPVYVRMFAMLMTQCEIKTDSYSSPTQGSSVRSYTFEINRESSG